jgi:hypothetical protein
MTTRGSVSRTRPLHADDPVADQVAHKAEGDCPQHHAAPERTGAAKCGAFKRLWRRPCTMGLRKLRH